MSRRPRRVPSWLEGTSNRTPNVKDKRNPPAVLPRSVVYVMSPKELMEAAATVLREETVSENVPSASGEKRTTEGGSSSDAFAQGSEGN